MENKKCYACVNVIEITNGIPTIEGCYPIWNKEKEKEIVEKAEEHFKQLVKKDIDESDTWDIWFDEFEVKTKNEVLDGFWDVGYDDGNGTEYRLDWGTVFDFN
jgi:hypothetical protein